MFGDSSRDVCSVAFRQVKHVSEGTDTTELAFFIGKKAGCTHEKSKSLTLPKFELKDALLATRPRQEVQCTISINNERCFM